MTESPEALADQNERLFRSVETVMPFMHEICREYLEGIHAIRNGTKIIVRYALIDGRPAAEVEKELALSPSKQSA